MSEATFGMGPAAAGGRPGSDAAVRPGRVSIEAHSVVPWLPVALGLGIAIYFLLPVEPPVAVMVAAAIGALAAMFGALARRSEPMARTALSMLAAALLGFALAQVRTETLATPMLTASAERIGLEASVERIEHLPAGVRVLLSNVTFERPGRLSWTREAPPRIRLRLTKNTPVPRVGDRIRVAADLHPFSEPVAPGAYDFRRDAFFKQIGATGYAVSRVTILAQGPPANDAGRFVEQLREAIEGRIAAHLEGDIAAVAQALLTGEQTAISEAALVPFRDSGLSHIFSISGLHIGLAAGIVFFAVRLVLALVPALALRYDIKRWAALAALVAAWAYTALVDFPIPAQRSAIMASLALIAIFFDRDPFSLRVIALAAGAVLLATPESLLSPSFQLSFAAVLGLICGWQALEPVFSLHQHQSAWPHRFLRALIRTFVSSLIASMATMPLLIYHFHTAQFYAALANALALPLMGAIVMPATVLTYAAMPLGLDGMTLAILGGGLEWLLWIARTVADLPGASIRVAPLPLWTLAGVTLLGLFLCLGPPRWRLLGWLAVPLLLAGLALHDPPQILAAADGEAVALRTPEGEMTLLHGRAAGFIADQWQGHWLTGRARTAPLPGAGTETLRCDRLGCILTLGGARTVAVSLDHQALSEDCRTAALVIAPLFAVKNCAATVIDRNDLRRRGAHALWLTEAGIRIETVADAVGRRPWAGFQIGSIKRRHPAGDQ